MIVTEIIPLDKRRDRVCLDEELFFALYKGELRKYGICAGGELSGEQYREIVDTVLQKRARERVLYILKNSDKTELELRRKLAEGYFPEEVVDSAIQFLKEYHFIDDEEYARRYAQSCASRKSRRRISFELQQKGIPKDTVSGILEECPAGEQQQIEKYLIRKGYAGRQLTRQEQSRLFAALARKGFSYDTIGRVMREQLDND